MAEERCFGLIPVEMGNTWKCTRWGIYFEDGHWWCGYHAPSQIARRARERAVRQQQGRE